MKNNILLSISFLLFFNVNAQRPSSLLKVKVSNGMLEGVNQVLPYLKEFLLQNHPWEICDGKNHNLFLAGVA